MFDLNELRHVNVLVVGDIMLDRYLWGDVSRISPEAPVPVVRIRNRTEVPGGSGNVAMNLSALSCSTTVIGLCGNDRHGRKLTDILSHNRVRCRIIVDESRPTITKTRIMARKQQLLRLDEEETHLLSTNLEQNILNIFQEESSTCGAVILSDYGKGMLQTRSFIREIIDTCLEKKISVLVDPKGRDWDRYRGVTCITPNTAELELVTGQSLAENEDALVEAARSIRETYHLRYLLVTRGAEGMCFIDSHGEPHLIPAQVREVFDVSGAGDTVIAALSAGMAADFPLMDSVRIANTAAGIVVGKVGTRPVTHEELSKAILSDISYQARNV